MASTPSVSSSAPFTPSSSAEPRSRPSSRRPLRQTVPFLSWPVFAAHFRREFEQGQHVTILGPTGTGKTTLALEVLEARTYILFISTKPRDPLITDLAKRGYRISDKLDIRVRDGHVIDRKFVFWPAKQTVKSSATSRERRMSIEEFRAYQKREVLRAIEYAWHAGGWCVYADETAWLTGRGEEGIGLGSQLNALWYQGRSSGVSLVAAAQRPSWIPRAAYSSPDHLFFFHSSDGADLERLSDIGGGIDKKQIEVEITSLKKHEFLYLRPREQPPLLVRSKVQLGR